MGILNVTPDSFSDGGQHDAREAALTHARSMIAEGADIIDVGGESTRPGADPAPEAEEMERTVPVIKAIRAESDIPISIDTMKPAVAEAAVRAGANIWNDVSALQYSEDSIHTAARLGVIVCLMHMRGEPRTMQANLEPYEDVAGEVAGFLSERAGLLQEAGLSREKIWLDPGLGFGKSARDNLTLTHQLDRLTGLGYPVLYGASRKRFIAAIDPSAEDARDRLAGSLAAALYAAKAGASVLRVHDVAETIQALRLWTAIESP